MANRVLVTGGSGFIGTNLVQALLDDDVAVLNLDHAQPIHSAHRDVFQQVDLLDRDAVLKAFDDFRPSEIVHLAARTDLDRDTTIEDYSANTTGTEIVLDAVGRTPSVSRILVTSSMLVCKLGYVPRADDDYAPTTRYGESKVLTEKITREKDPEVTWALIRPTTIWGPWHLRLEQEIFSALRRRYYVHPAGRPCRRSYGFVGNSVHQIRRLLECPGERLHRKTLYIGDPAIELFEFVDGFSRRMTGKGVRSVPYPLLKGVAIAGDGLAALGWKGVPLTSYRLSNMTCDNVLDVDPTLELTGANPYSLEDGIERTVAWLDRRKSSQGAAAAH